MRVSVGDVIELDGDKNTRWQLKKINNKYFWVRPDNFSERVRVMNFNEISSDVIESTTETNGWKIVVNKSNNFQSLYKKLSAS